MPEPDGPHADALAVPARVALADGEVDLRRRVVERAGQTARLSTLEAQLLGYLAAQPGQVVSRDALLEDVWGYSVDVATRAVDNTVRRLRTKIEVDARRPVHVLTVHGSGYRFEPPDPASVPARPAGRPPSDPGVVDATFVGRANEQRRLRDLTEAGVHLVTLVGPGGVGKTRLARQVAARSALAATFCDLSEATTPAGLHQATADALGVALTGADAGATLASVGQALASRGAVLVVLDNAEQVLGPCAEALAAWRAAAPQVCFLVTSREALGLEDERVVPLEPLDEADAVTLFVARAVAHDRQVAQTPRALLTQIVNRLDRLPLAIELASPRLAVLSPREVLTGLDERFRLLATGSAWRPERQQTLRAALAWSWELMTQTEQRALAQLSVFRGGFDVAAATAVVALEPGAPWIVDVLAALVAKSVLQRAQRDAGPARFELLVSVAEFAAEQLDTLALTEPTRARHGTYVVTEGQRRVADLRGPQANEALTWLSWERHNLVAAWERARTTDAERCGRLALVLDALLERRGPVEQRLEVLRGAAALALDGPLAGRVWVALAGLRRSLGDLRGAREAVEALDALALGEAVAVERAVLEGQIARHQGDPNAALAAFEAAVAGVATRDPDTVGVDAWLSLGALHQERDAHASARGAYREALELATRLDDRPGLATVHSRLGTIAMERGERGDAEAHFAAAVAHHEGVGDRRQLAIALSNLAVLLHEAGRLDDSEARWSAALVIHREVGNRRFEGFALAGLGLLAVERGAHELGLAQLRQACALFEAARDRRFLGVARARRAVAEAALGYVIEARASLETARACFEEAEVAWGLEGLPWIERLVAWIVDPAAEDGAALRRAARARQAAARWSFERLALRLVISAGGRPG